MLILLSLLSEFKDEFDQSRKGEERGYLVYPHAARYHLAFHFIQNIQSPG
jgi:hypothetical protein